jgi:hypothetical protein
VISSTRSRDRSVAAPASASEDGISAWRTQLAGQRADRLSKQGWMSKGKSNSALQALSVLIRVTSFRRIAYRASEVPSSASQSDPFRDPHAAKAAAVVVHGARP